MNLQGKTAVVTGGTRGIGKAITLELVRRGATVAFTGRSIGTNSENVERAAREIGGTAKGYAFDAGDAEAAAKFVGEVLNDFGKIDILINNAGITKDNLLMRMTEEDWDAVLRTNLKSVFNLTKAVVTPMMKARSGAIVNIASVVGVHGNAGQANYAASKAGIIGFSKSVARELGSRNIRVNVIAPGFVETDMTAVLSEKVQAEYEKGIPLKRFAQPEDIANAVLFLASDDAAYITGQVLEVSGGLFM